MTVEGNTEAAVEFLVRFSPEGPHWLTAIHPEQPGLRAATFRGDQIDDMRKWIAERNGKYNLYFQTNPLMCDLVWYDPKDPRNKTKAERTDVLAFRTLHVDLDPWTDESQEDAKVRLIKQIEAYHIRAPIITCSGGGVQAFWRLEAPIEVNGDLAIAEDVKKFNIQLERELEGDGCHNIDRIMRLPGTVNLPNAKKLKKGRVAALATVHRFEDTKYPITQFLKAPDMEDRAGGDSPITVNISGNLPRFMLDDLGWMTPQIKELIEKSTKGGRMYGSRSEAVLACVCAMVRAGAEDDTMASIITDPDFKISESIREKKNVKREVQRVISRSREMAVDKDLEIMNAKYACISSHGGAFRILEESYDEALGKEVISFTDKASFVNRFENIRKDYMITEVDGKDKLVRSTQGEWWLKQKYRRGYDTVTFLPQQPCANAYNLWAGFGCQALPGNKHLFYLDHMREIICGGDETLYQYLVNWLARSVQVPYEPGYSAIIMRGAEGTGKGFFAREWLRLFGRHGKHITDRTHFIGKFNEHMRDTVALFLDEAFFAGDKSHEGKLKTIITEPTFMCEPKGVNIFEVKNCSHTMMASNSDHVIPAGQDARRFFVVDVLSTRMRDFDYFTRGQAEMDGGGRENLLYFLATVNIAGFRPQDVPLTAALADQKMLSMSNEQAWWFDKLTTGILRSGCPWESPVPIELLMDDYYAHSTESRTGRAHNRIVIRRFIEDKAVPKDRIQIVTQQNTMHEKLGSRFIERQVEVPCWVFPPLNECRAHWDRTHPGGTEWRKPLPTTPVSRQQDLDMTPF